MSPMTTQLGSVETRGGRHDRMDYPDFQHRLGHI